MKSRQTASLPTTLEKARAPFTQQRLSGFAKAKQRTGPDLVTTGELGQ